MEPTSIFQAIQAFSAKEPAFERYTSPILWNDPWISRQMLKAHLDPSNDGASRNPEFIAESVDFIATRFGAGQACRIADFGCGPGLYASALARRGACLTGIDLSENSIAYARERARENGLAINYVLGDYLETPLKIQADLALLIWCDFGALSPENGARLLANIKASLKPGGRLFLDVFSLEHLRERRETREWSFHDGGFMSGKPHAQLFELLAYPRESAFLEKYLVLEEERSFRIDVWNRCFSPESLAETLAGSGFEVEELYADARGRPLEPNSPTIAAAARLRD
jgi:SAM-dependent methyltransferase